SGAAPASAAGTPTTRQQILGDVSAGVTGLLEGVDLADVAPESVVKIPAGRLIGSQLVSSVLWIVFFGVIYLVAIAGMLFGMTADGNGSAEIALAVIGLSLGMGIPLVIAVVAITW